MKLKPLGRTGVGISEIGVGTWQYSAGPAPIRRAIELGATFIDAAELYKNEAMVGDAIAGVREQVFLATKVSPEHFKRADVRAAADRSLTLLKTDRIDLYQLHWPNEAIPLEETLGAMEELVDAGKIRFIGVSNFGSGRLALAQKIASKHGIVSNQVKYNLVDREIELDLIPFCQANGVTVIAYSPLATGLDHITAKDPDGALVKVAAQTGRTPAQVALNWSVRLPGVVSIPKSNSVARMEENCAASGWTLTPAQLSMLDQIQFARQGRLEHLARRTVGGALRKLGLR